MFFLQPLDDKLIIGALSFSAPLPTSQQLRVQRLATHQRRAGGADRLRSEEVGSGGINRFGCPRDASREEAEGVLRAELPGLVLGRGTRELGVRRKNDRMSSGQKMEWKRKRGTYSSHIMMYTLGPP